MASVGFIHKEFVFDMFGTTKFSSSGSLYQQLYGIFIMLINSLVAVKHILSLTRLLI